MNRLGMIVDLTHLSNKAMLDAIAASATPVLFSHASAYSIFAHTRNVQDDVLQKLVVYMNNIEKKNFKMNCSCSFRKKIRD